MDYSKEFLVGLYRRMLSIRLCEESFVEPILSGDVGCPCHLYSGEEAVAVGICAFLDEKDYMFGNHRSHGHYLAKGGSLKEMVAEIYCKETGCARGRGGSMHLIAPEVGFLGAAPIVAGTISLALGAALAAKAEGERRVAVSFFGDGATGEGVLYESLNFAALEKLPIIFVCENNLYATHMPLREIRPTDKDILEIAKSLGIEAAAVDGNDVLAVCEIARAAVEQCRTGGGPFFIEASTYRYRGHVGPNDNIQGTQTDIRPQAEIEAWRGKDPLQRLLQHITGRGIATAAELRTIEAEVTLLICEAHKFAVDSPAPAGEDLTEYVYRQR